MQPDDAMSKRTQVWFFAVDAGRGRLMRCARVSHGRLHVEEVSTIEPDEEEHEHGRPSPRSGKTGNTYASEGHEDEYQLRRFAKEVVAWMETHAERIDASPIRLFAAPRFLGELRKLYSQNLVERIEEHRADLTQFSTAGMAKHPAVAQLLPN